MVCLRDGAYKYIACPADPALLFDLAQDPNERCNLIDHPDHADVQRRLADEVARFWNFDRFDGDIRDSQARRLIVYEALRGGTYYPWDYQPLRDASDRYMRNHMNLDLLENSQRFPRGE
jgi:choline-sulfatase